MFSILEIQRIFSLSLYFQLINSTAYEKDPHCHFPCLHFIFL